MPKSKYSWLLFDADGTLFDYESAEETAITKTFVQLGYEFSWFNPNNYIISIKMRSNFKVSTK